MPSSAPPAMRINIWQVYPRVTDHQGAGPVRGQLGGPGPFEQDEVNGFQRKARQSAGGAARAHDDHGQELQSRLVVVVLGQDVAHLVRQYGVHFARAVIARQTGKNDHHRSFCPQVRALASGVWVTNSSGTASTSSTEAAQQWRAHRLGT